MERVQIYFKILVKLQFLPISLQFSVVYDSHDKLVQGVQVGHDLGPGHGQHQLRVQQHYNISPPPLVKILLYTSMRKKKNYGENRFFATSKDRRNDGLF